MLDNKNTKLYVHSYVLQFLYTVNKIPIQT